MKLVYLNQLGKHLDPVYIKPENLERVARLIKCCDVTANVKNSRRQLDRRCGVERRCRQHTILLDTRSSHRRKSGPRRQQEAFSQADGNPSIDVFA